MWKNIVTTFRVLKTIIFDNGRQFDFDKVQDNYADYGIQMTVVAGPQSSVQDESTIQQILNGFKKRLDTANGMWADELLVILWSMGTTKKSPMEETPFMLVYGSEAILLIKVAIHNHRVVVFQETFNNQALQEALDLLPMVRRYAYLIKEIAKARLNRFYN